MFYCRECKKKANTPFCENCGKAFTVKDEIVYCPACSKMFMKPSNDFNCTKCGARVSVSAAPQQQTNVATTQANVNMAQNMQPQNQSVQGVAQNQNMQPQMAQNQSVQGAAQPQMAQNAPQGYNQFVQNAPQGAVQNQAGVANVNGVNAYGTQNVNQQDMQNATQAQMQNNVGANAINGQNVNQNLNLNTSNSQVAMQENVASTLNANAMASALFEQNQTDNQAQNAYGQSVNFAQAREQANAANLSQPQPSTTSDIVQNDSIYGQGAYYNDTQNVVDSENVGSNTSSVDMANSFASASTQNASSTSFDTSQFEVVKVSQGSSKKAKKAKEVSLSSSEDKPRSSKGMLIFAMIELVVILALVGYIGYNLLSPYIMQTDPVKRAWADAYQMQVQAHEILGQESTEMSNISLVESSDDGVYAVYKVEDNIIWLVFKIDKKFAIEGFINFSTAKVVDICYSEQSALDSMENQV